MEPARQDEDQQDGHGKVRNRYPGDGYNPAKVVGPGVLSYSGKHAHRHSYYAGHSHRKDSQLHRDGKGALQVIYDGGAEKVGVAKVQVEHVP